jgi:hypothetical protein
MNRAMSEKTAEQILLENLNSIAKQIVERGMSGEEFRRNLVLALCDEETRLPPWLKELGKKLITTVLEFIGDLLED